ncbi:DUF859 family phage minor structural protein [Streptococcus pluranimalium]|uniref:DUF859 family phage minor structural protein n=1 Tax=Streptococcus pluranimalium TaxID=82348 RepID=UPI004046FA90
MAEFHSGSDAKGYSLKLVVDQTSQSTANNTSQVRLRLYLINTRMTFAQYTVNASITADGQRIPYSGSPSVLTFNSTTQLIDRTITIKHTDSGAKSFTVSATLSGSGGYSPNTINLSNQTFTLTTIARSSTLTVPNLTLGESSTIKVNKTNAAYTHTIRYEIGTLNGTIASNVSDQTTWKPDFNLATQITTSKTGTVTLYVDTFNGSTKLGTVQTKATVIIPEHLYTRPTLSNVTLSDANAKTQAMVTGNNFVQIFSDIIVNFGNTSAKYGASITSYTAEIVGRNQATNTNGGRLGPMQFNGAATIRASVTDSRGITSNPVDIRINVLEYAPPVLSFIARRGNQNQSSKTIVITRNAKIAPLSVNGRQTNNFKLTFKVAKAGTNNFVTDTGPANTNSRYINSYVNSEANLRGVYDNFESYEVLGILEDNFTSSEFRMTVTTERGVWGEAETAFSFGKAPELKEAVDSDWQYYYNKKPIQHHQLTDNAGSAFNDYSSDFDAQIISGYYHKSSSAPNNPSGRWGLLHVISGGTHVVQYFAECDGTRTLFLRAKTNGNWTKWVEYAKANHQNLINTGWVGTGVDGVTAKRIGDMVYININSISLTKATEFRLGTLPKNMRPNFNLMLDLAVWAVNNESVKLQLSTSGAMVVLGPSVVNGRTLSTQFSFAI